VPNNLTNQQSTAERVFQAIDGTELRKIILAEIDRAMEQDSKFKRHLTYPVFSFAYNIVISAYPMEPAEFKVAGKYKRVSAGAEIPTDVEPESIKVAGELNVDAPAEGGLAPDEARERAGLAVPTPTRAQVGKGAQVTVDEGRLASPPDDAADTVEDPAALASGTPTPTQMQRLQKQRDGQGGKAEPHNRPEASPRFARSVNLKTPAEPDGARVDDNVTGR
jgi:hypothetical protein